MKNQLPRTNIKLNYGKIFASQTAQETSTNSTNLSVNKAVEETHIFFQQSEKAFQANLWEGSCQNMKIISKSSILQTLEQRLRS